ncbi:replication initiation factor domain-containing protein [Enterococcus sp. LJL51]|uniref:replication initiation factor domain-containing protein n=1 Tax=Enterococcus sp. LJL51 TaxID=3416656 RepID=UPI003CF57D2B
MTGEELKKVRKRLGYSLRKFSEKVGVSKSTLSDCEKGKFNLSEEKVNQIKIAIGLPVKFGHQLHVHWDYLKFTFFDSSIEIILEHVLKIPVKYFVIEQSRKNNYERKYSCGHIVIFDRMSDSRQGILLDLTGQGVYEFEQHLEGMGLNYREWFRKILNPNWYSSRGYYSRIHSTRTDIAIDEMYDPINGNFNLHELKKRRDRDLIQSDFRVYREQEKKFNAESGGLTLYYGARGGNMFVRFYEKRYELADKLRTTVDDVLQEYGIWNRYELELGKDVNEQIFDSYLAGEDLDEIAINLLLSKFEVYDEKLNESGSIERTYYEEFYQIFGSWKSVKINSKQEESSLEKSLRWIELQVIPTLRMIELVFGKDRFRKWLFKALDNVELSEKQKKQVLYERMIEDKGLNE